MKIYIRCICKDTGGNPAWYNDTSVKEDYDTGRVKKIRTCAELYMERGWDIYGKPAYFFDWLRGTPATSIAEAKKNAKIAKSLMWDDGYGDSIVQFWMIRNGDYQMVKFEKNGKIKKIGSYEKDMHADFDRD